MPRHPVPRLWLMTDDRQGDALWHALARLPRGAGVIFRHYGLPATDRRALYDRVRALARRRRLVLVLAGSPRLAAAWHADGAHGHSPHRRTTRPMLRTAPAHDRAELCAAARRGCNAVLLSPIFATRSHPGASHLGVARFGLLARGSAVPVIALGGMTARRGRAVVALGAIGWAAIDSWSEGVSLHTAPSE